MATINKKITATQFERIGDTQGLLIPQGSKFMQVKANGVNPVSTVWQLLSFDTSTVEGENWIDGGRVKAPVKGLYSMSVQMFDGTVTTVSDVWLMVRGNAAPLRFVSGKLDGLAAYGYNGVSGLLPLNAGEYVNIQVASPVSNQALGNTLVSMVLLEQQVPGIIANKGALKSGGAFTFDEDGNCYTENYSTTEMRVGKWIDNKPLYKKTISFTTVAAPENTTAVIGQKSLISNEIETIVKSEVCELRSGSLTQTVACYITVNGNDLMFRTFTLWGSGYMLYLTAYYTKTTDVPE